MITFSALDYYQTKSPRTEVNILGGKFINCSICNSKIAQAEVLDCNLVNNYVEKSTIIDSTFRENVVVDSLVESSNTLLIKNIDIWSYIPGTTSSDINQGVGVVKLYFTDSEIDRFDIFDTIHTTNLNKTNISKLLKIEELIELPLETKWVVNNFFNQDFSNDEISVTLKSSEENKWKTILIRELDEYKKITYLNDILDINGRPYGSIDIEIGNYFVNSYFGFTHYLDFTIDIYDRPLIMSSTVSFTPILDLDTIVNFDVVVKDLSFNNIIINQSVVVPRGKTSSNKTQLFDSLNYIVQSSTYSVDYNVISDNNISWVPRFSVRVIPGDPGCECCESTTTVLECPVDLFTYSVDTQTTTSTTSTTTAPPTTTTSTTSTTTTPPTTTTSTSTTSTTSTTTTPPTTTTSTTTTPPTTTTSTTSTTTAPPTTTTSTTSTTTTPPTTTTSTTSTTSTTTAPPTTTTSTTSTSTTSTSTTTTSTSTTTAPPTTTTTTEEPTTTTTSTTTTNLETYSISGTFRYFNTGQTPFVGITVSLFDSSVNFVTSSVTNYQGDYDFGTFSFNQYNSFYIKIGGVTNSSYQDLYGHNIPWGGVSNADASSTPTLSTINWWAKDVNGDGVLNSVDGNLIQARSFNPANTTGWVMGDWVYAINGDIDATRFYPGWQMTNTQPSHMSIGMPFGPTAGSNFMQIWALCVGDTNGSYVPISPTTSTTTTSTTTTTTTSTTTTIPTTTTTTTSTTTCNCSNWRVVNNSPSIETIGYFSCLTNASFFTPISGGQTLQVCSCQEPQQVPPGSDFTITFLGSCVSG